MDQNDTEIWKRLAEVNEAEWEAVVKKCYTHIQIKLYKKKASGAHSATRLGMEAEDFYTGQAIEAMFKLVWKWKFKEYSLEEQLIRIINSMISEEVRKYQREVDKNPKVVSLPPENFDDNQEDENSDQDGERHALFSTALHKACENNDQHQKFLELKKRGETYEKICHELACSPQDAYRIMEAISRKAKKLLKAAS